MAVTLDQFATYCRSQNTFKPGFEAIAELILASAEEQVTSYLNGGTAPEATRDLAVLSLGSELITKAQSPAGWRQVSQDFAGRVSVDSMGTVRPLLRAYRRPTSPG